MSALKSILLCRCPKCYQGKIFTDPNPYHLSHLSEMEKRCPVCDFDLENETGFHFLSMYMSYIVSMGFSFVFIIPLTFILGLEWQMYNFYLSYTNCLRMQLIRMI